MTTEPTVTTQIFKDSLRLFATGVTVVSWNDGDGIEGITVSAFSSLSLEPPLVLFCVANNSRLYAQISNLQTAVINILSDKQTDIAYLFAGRERANLQQHITRDNCFAQAALIGSCVNLAVKIVKRIAAGDHDIIICSVCDSKINNELAPLIYHDGKMGTPRA